MEAISNKRPNPRRSRMLVLAVLALAVSAGWAAPGRADLIVEVPNIQASAGSSGSFDVLLTNTGPDSPQVASYNVELSLTGPPGVQFTGATIGTVTPYIFQVSGGPPLSFDPFPNTDFTASDSEFASPFFDTIAPGETVGLVHVLFSVDANAPLGGGTIDVVAAGTQFSDSDFGVFASSALAGTFTVVPEPSTFLLFGFAGIALAGWRLWRRSPILPQITGCRLP